MAIRNDNSIELLYDQEEGKFTRGDHEGESIEGVADSDYGYLIFVRDYANTDEESKLFVENWMEAHPDYGEE